VPVAAYIGVSNIQNSEENGKMDTTQAHSYLDSLEKIAVEVVRPTAVEIDQNGTFPRTAMDTLSKGGLLGLVSAREVGGMGQGLRAAAFVIERVAQECASTAMVLCMHYAGTAVIEAHGPLAVREAIAAGKHITTLAFSEKGSRSHFWAPRHCNGTQRHRSSGRSRVGSPPRGGR
jgi:alkylation response protein AidB-like acyl-CoA dehydrogenase